MKTTKNTSKQNFIENMKAAINKNYESGLLKAAMNYAQEEDIRIKRETIEEKRLRLSKLVEQADVIRREIEYLERRRKSGVMGGKPNRNKVNN